MDPPELTTNRKNTPIIVDTDTGEVLAKRCSKCGGMKLRKNMKKGNRAKDRMDSICLTCKKGISAKWYEKNKDNPENKKRKAEYDAEYNAIPENKKRQAERVAEWSRNNTDKRAKYDAKRNARKRNLPSEDISSISFEKCELTGDTSNVHIEHFIPLNWGHGGTIPGNVYAMEGTANISKGNRNPFSWFESHDERFGITSASWSGLIEELASRNGITAEEFESFVYWCEANKRKLEQIKADNERYGYIVDSLTLYREAMANMATREIA